MAAGIGGGAGEVLGAGYSWGYRKHISCNSSPQHNDAEARARSTLGDCRRTDLRLKEFDAVWKFYRRLVGVLKHEFLM